MRITKLVLLSISLAVGGCDYANTLPPLPDYAVGGSVTPVEPAEPVEPGEPSNPPPPDPAPDPNGLQPFVITWDLPVTFIDGTPLDPALIKSYQIRIADESDNQIVRFTTTTTQTELPVLSTGIFLLSVRTVLTDGRRSAWSAPQLTLIVP